MNVSVCNLSVGARSSLLSKAQLKEVEEELRVFHPQVEFVPSWLETTGDLDLKTSLRTLGKTDFFTREIDQMQLSGRCRISIHSAKDLPEPLTPGLVLVALTKGVDSSDCLVCNGELRKGARIGASCERRDLMVKALRADLVCADIRGTIDRRLALLDAGEYDGVVMAEAALIRLGLTHRQRIPLPGETAPLQGQLAVLAREGDLEMAELFSCIDTRAK